MIRLEVTIQFQGSMFVDNNITLDKVKVEKNQPGFLITKTVDFIGDLLPRFENAPVHPHFKMMLSEGYRAKSWAENLSAVFTFLTGAHVFSTLKNVNQVSEPQQDGSHFITGGMAHGEQVAEPPKVQLTVKILEAALELVKELTLDPSRELVRRAIGWYARGMIETDLVYKFLDHWISLETLSNVYDGKVEAATCSACHRVLNKRPGRGVLREFLRGLGHENFIPDIMKCSGIRANLFHQAGAEAEATSMQPTLSEHLRECLFEWLKTSIG